MVGWAFLADAVPIYALYALLFAEHGLSGAEISALFALWSLTGLVFEVPTGALADRFSRRWSLVAAGIGQAMGFASWLLAPGFLGFALGFVLWGIGGSLASGALEALLYDGLAAQQAGVHYPRVLGRVRAAGLLAQVPVAASAGLLFALGGFALVGWVSVGVCLATAAIARGLPEPARGPEDPADDGPGYLALLRAGFGETVTRRTLALAVVAVAALTGVDGLEEYFPLVAADLGVPTQWNPAAVAGIPLAGALGAVLAGRWGSVPREGRRPPRPSLPVLLAVAAAALWTAAVVRQPVALVAVAGFYGCYRGALVLVEARLQELITGPSRATVTSIAGLLTEIAALGLFGLWAVGGMTAVAVGFATLVVVVPPLLGRGGTARGRGGSADSPPASDPDGAGS